MMQGHVQNMISLITSLLEEEYFDFCCLERLSFAKASKTLISQLNASDNIEHQMELIDKFIDVKVTIETKVNFQDRYIAHNDVNFIEN